MKRVYFTPHAREHMTERGTSEGEVLAALSGGESAPAKFGRLAFRKNFPFEQVWRGRYYETKQVMPIVRDETDR